MIYPDNFEEKTGFDKIRQIIIDLCISDTGALVAKKMRPFFTYEKIIHQLNITEEYRTLLLLSEKIPTQNYLDLTDTFKEVLLPGTFLETEELGIVRASLETLTALFHFFEPEERAEQYPLLTELSKHLYVSPEIPQELNKLLDEKGQIRSDASETLYEVRQEITKKQRSIDHRIHKIAHEARQQGILKEDTEITIRNGRPVIPVPAAHKRRLKGWIHDESATGQTVYIEPTEIFEVNNEIRELALLERREIVKILTAFTDYLRPFIPELNKAYCHLGEFDFIGAKAKLALQTASIRPIVRRRPVINIRHARHPLLYLSFKKQQRKVVPLTLSLSHKERILVISGPNAGGKSICLKTIGLLQYMLQCGLLIPTNENSEFGIFRHILIDIGDEQSLENDLSTYTSHLQNMKTFLRNADRHTLFLIDEFGTGTEPNLGGAIAEATLEKLNEQKAWGVVTTHYANLKLMSGKHPGIINGAMLFDTHKLQPLFLLETGKPGSSFAFEIARKIGFPNEILKRAETKTGKKQLDFDQQLQQLEIEKKHLTKRQTEVSLADDLLKELIEKYKKRVLELEQKHHQIIAQAHEQAEELIEKANTRIEHTIKEIKEAQAEKEKTKRLRKQLKESASQRIKQNHEALHKLKKRLEEVEETKAKKAPEQKRPKPVTFHVGDYVKLRAQKSIGIITQIRNQKATVEVNTLSIHVDLKSLEPATPPTTTPKQVRLTTSSSGNIVHDLSSKAANFRISIDVRGQRAEEALANLTKYVDDAILLNIPEIKILHGKGNGILRDVIRDYLRSIPEVQRYRNEALELGGDGITVVSLRY
ncbi:MAG: endonuclease MutS2 [Bacteroidetes bacterium]|nr:MAG: endonuclease MutS2 [Bacteroidota bacterium]PIE88160.1 MAG: endonuclease MutS2 [Bacteroidota bacterium]